MPRPEPSVSDLLDRELKKVESRIFHLQARREKLLTARAAVERPDGVDTDGESGELAEIFREVAAPA